MTSLNEIKQELLSLLQTAVEFELATIPVYMTALLSIKADTNQQAASSIRSVMIEEMLHMTLAANVLSSIGGELQLNQTTIPQYPLTLEFEGKRLKDREFDINLAAFSEDNITVFTRIELPDNWPAIGQSIQASAEMEVPGYTIGEFYQLIIDKLQTLCDQYGEQVVFTGDSSWQINENYYWSGGGKPIVVTDLKTAKQAIQVITEQGEGCSGSIFDGDHKYFDQDKEVAHFFRFKEILFGRRYQSGDHPMEPPTGAQFEVNYQESYPILTNAKESNFSSDPAMKRLNDQFNQQYTLMLQQLEKAFNGAPENLYTAILSGMHDMVSISQKMMRTPVAGDPQGRHGAPSFDWRPLSNTHSLTPKYTKQDDSMISLTSKWMLKNGCPEELYQELAGLADTVKAAEPDTLMYMVHLDAPQCLDEDNNPIEPPPQPIALPAQRSVTFFEAYKDEVAFSRHVNGPVFQGFLKNFGHYFEQDSSSPGWPVTENGLYQQVSGFARSAIDN